jgi:crossover junction endodeoxyribonuclease RuvC
MGKRQPEVNSLRFVGLDLSLTATGLVVLDHAAFVTSKEVISSKKTEVLRLVEIADRIVIAIRPFKNEASVYMEGYSFASRSGQAFSIGELGGVVKAYLFKEGITPKIIPPTSLKKFVTGKGNAKKELMLKEVYKKWGVDFDDNNLADAYGLARHALWDYAAGGKS